MEVRGISAGHISQSTVQMWRIRSLPHQILACQPKKDLFFGARCSRARWIIKYSTLPGFALQSLERALCVFYWTATTSLTRVYYSAAALLPETNIRQNSSPILRQPEALAGRKHAPAQNVSCVSFGSATASYPYP